MSVLIRSLPVEMKNECPASSAAAGQLCPSYRCEAGALLLGVVRADGTIAMLSGRNEVGERFVEIANAGRSPESRFRFAGACVEAGCQHWSGQRCGVIDRVLVKLETVVAPKPLPDSW